MDPQTYVDRLATLAVEVGANVQDDQIVAVSYAPGMEPLAYAIAEKAYQRGARFVDPFVFDGAIKGIRRANRDSAHTGPGRPRGHRSRARRKGRPSVPQGDSHAHQGRLDELVDR